jgi:hypothetical protein
MGSETSPMSEGLKIALTALAGIIVFIIGQIIVKSIIEPIQEQRRTIGDIAHALKYYKNYQSQITTLERIQEGIVQVWKPCQRLA